MLLMDDSGAYDLAPAVDLPPSGQALGYQQMRVGAAAGWRAHFLQAGVSAADIESLAAQIDRPFLRDQRQAC